MRPLSKIAPCMALPADYLAISGQGHASLTVRSDPQWQGRAGLQGGSVRPPPVKRAYPYAPSSGARGQAPDRVTGQGLPAVRLAFRSFVADRPSGGRGYGLSQCSPSVVTEGKENHSAPMSVDGLVLLNADTRVRVVHRCRAGLNSFKELVHPDNIGRRVIVVDQVGQIMTPRTIGHPQPGKLPLFAVLLDPSDRIAGPQPLRVITAIPKLAHSNFFAVGLHDDTGEYGPQDEIGYQQQNPDGDE